MSNSKKELYEFYESIIQGNKCFSPEELDVAIESLKLAQQTLKQSNQSNLQRQKVKPSDENIVTQNTVSPEVPITQETENNKLLPLPSYNV